MSNENNYKDGSCEKTCDALQIDAARRHSIRFRFDYDDQSEQGDQIPTQSGTA